MPLPSDFVSRGCVSSNEGCTLINKCDECKKEILSLIRVDEMYIDYFKQLDYLKKRAEEKESSAETPEKKN